MRERTQKWEARGGGLSSYFSTLPKSFRHKATDPRGDPTYMYGLQSPTGEGQFFEEDEEEEGRMTSRTSVSSRGSQSGIPLPTSKLLQPRSSLPVGVGTSRSVKSVSPGPGRDEREEGARSVNSGGQYPSSNDSSLERRIGVVSQENGERQAKGRGKGASNLPTRSSGLQVSCWGRGREGGRWMGGRGGGTDGGEWRKRVSKRRREKMGEGSHAPSAKKAKGLVTSLYLASSLGMQLATLWSNWEVADLCSRTISRLHGQQLLYSSPLLLLLLHLCLATASCGYLVCANWLAPESVELVLCSGVTRPFAFFP